MTVLLQRLDHAPRLSARIAVALCLFVGLTRIVLALLTPAPEMTPDGLGYDDAARRILSEGHYAWVYPGVYVAEPPPNAVHLPGYAYFLSGLYAIADGTSVDPRSLVAVAQGLASAFTLWGMFLVGRALNSSTTGLTAVVFGATYPPFWLSYRYVLTEDLFAALCVWATWAMLTAIASSDWRAYTWYAVAAALATAATYVRAAAALWMMLAGATLIVGDGARRIQHLRGAAVALITATLIMSPWWIRNARIYEEFVPFNTLTATGALVAAHDDPDTLLADLNSLDRGHLDPAQELEYNQEVRQLARIRQAEAFSEDPLGYTWRRIQLLAISILTYHPNPFGGFSGWGGAVELIHLAALALAARGTWLYRRRPGVWILLALPAALFALHATTLAFSRYFFPMMPLVIVLACLALSGRPDHRFRPWESSEP